MELLKPPDCRRPVVWRHDRAAGGVMHRELRLQLAGRMGFIEKDR
jgi:hypothetical protein